MIVNFFGLVTFIPKGNLHEESQKLRSELFMCDTKVSDFCMHPTSTECASVGLKT